MAPPPMKIMFRPGNDIKERTSIPSLEELGVMSDTQIEDSVVGTYVAVHGDDTEVYIEYCVTGAHGPWESYDERVAELGARGLEVLPPAGVILQSFDHEAYEFTYRTLTDSQGRTLAQLLPGLAVVDPEECLRDHRTFLKLHWHDWCATQGLAHQALAKMRTAEINGVAHQVIEYFGPFVLGCAFKTGKAWISSTDGSPTFLPEGAENYVLGVFDLPPVGKQQLDAILTLVMVVFQRGWYNRLDQLILPEDWHVFFVVAAVLCRIVVTLREGQPRTMTGELTMGDDMKLAQAVLTDVLGMFHELTCSLDRDDALSRSSCQEFRELWLTAETADTSEEFSYGWWLHQLTEIDWTPRWTYPWSSPPRNMPSLTEQGLLPRM